MNFKIFVEGEADLKFIKDFVKIQFNQELLKNDVIILGGWTGIIKEKDKFIINSGPNNDEGINLVILDADDETNLGGFEKRKAELLAFKKELKIEFELFLFPINNQNGDLEMLLSRIINPENQEIFDCWNGFERCISSLKKEYTVPARKTKIYAYLEVLHGTTGSEKDKIKDRNRDFTKAEHWDLNHEQLLPLYNFLAPHFAA
ncbi:MAG: hypothetical protein H7Z76_00665 [Methylotenera sp.]|nr:hypothetical protein [Flavobacterium sp.]